ncbi:phosphotransferase family protein [Alkalihalobacillus sp. BA299]|uniref:phosphotransferase family protein n=1 Tax=Alkalihalobacillus sp. BA299 TaxID=2815938 RepID=UPI001ADC4AC9|nr:phosphotransferase family protein [Alkalihalobacillus sp. BA299]
MKSNENDMISSVREGEDFNREAFHSFLLTNVDWWPNEPLEVTQFSSGYSNLTYLIRCGEVEVVMRRPPLGPLPPKAHDMKREFSLLKKLYAAFPYVPKTYTLCEDESIIGVPFYVMERKKGLVFDGKFPQGFTVTEEKCKQISYAAVDTLAQLHQIDYREVGLENFGRPEGFIERQVHNWIKRYERSKTHDIPHFEIIAKWFTENIPSSNGAAVIHNDYKLNNMMFSEKNVSKVESVFDWELATIADPLFDLAAALGYWTEPNDWESVKTSLPSLTTTPGFISRDEYIHRYSLKTSQDIPPLHFYMAFTYFKIAVVMQQIYFRWFNGQTKDSRFATLDISIRSLMEYANEIIITKKF